MIQWEASAHDVFFRDKYYPCIWQVLKVPALFRKAGIKHTAVVPGAFRGGTPIGKLMHDFSCTDPADMNYDVLAGRVKFFKESEKGDSIMCKAMEDMRLDEREEGRKKEMKKSPQVC